MGGEQIASKADNDKSAFWAFVVSFLFAGKTRQELAKNTTKCESA